MLGLGALSRLALDEAPNRRHGLPHGFRESSGTCGRDANRSRAGLGRQGRRRTREEGNECGNLHEHGTLDANRSEKVVQATYS